MAPRRKHSHQSKEKNDEYEAWLNSETVMDLKTSNPLLYKVIHLKDPKEIVVNAFAYRQMYENLPLVEWSEAVLLQLCDLSVKMSFSDMLWKDALAILENQWNHNLYNTTLMYLGKNRSIGLIIERNHMWKVKRAILPSEYTFCTTPCVDYKRLKEYKILPLDDN